MLVIFNEEKVKAEIAEQEKKFNKHYNEALEAIANLKLVENWFNITYRKD